MPRVRNKPEPVESQAFSGLATRYVQAAIAHGILPVLDGSVKCADCDSPAAVYDHRDYCKPLEVEGVCVRCNILRGPATGGILYEKLYVRRMEAKQKSAQQITNAVHRLGLSAVASELREPPGRIERWSKEGASMFRHHFVEKQLNQLGISPHNGIEQSQ